MQFSGKFGKLAIQVKREHGKTESQPKRSLHSVTRSLRSNFDLSVIIPAYNESERLPPFLRRAVGFLEARKTSYEIIVVDDGSSDNTAQLVESFAEPGLHIRLIRSAYNKGKGAAVRRGMQAAHGHRQLFADADGATPIEELNGLEQALETGADVAIGSRSLASRSLHHTVYARWHRTVLGLVFNALVQRLGLDGIEDTQCGFKLFRQPVARDLFSLATIDGYGLDLELLYVAKRRGYHIVEVPVNWADQPGSKVHPLRDGISMLRSLLEVRRRSTQGLYGVDRRPFPSLDPAVHHVHRSQLQ